MLRIGVCLVWALGELPGLGSSIRPQATKYGRLSFKQTGRFFVVVTHQGG
jgi:hypothetical protein